ncbi:hypothetical protein HK097_010477 [Rhizophlyctis rosea]|uniref:Uncharacterized protein n=1 Tax=Rhizophlyctis rosea TaxID=64517 RepID=A0AAD5SPA5_9FUNG|nr:hypothetical protein HK097_010477 [Rhizophlyctis rosea]
MGRRLRFPATLIPNRPPYNDPHSELQIRQMIAKVIQNDFSPQILVDYCGNWQQVRDAELPAFLEPQQKEGIKSRRLELQGDRIVAVMKRLNPSSREIFQIREGITNAYVDAGIFAEKKGSDCHYVEYTEDSVTGHEVRVHLATRSIDTRNF